MPFIEIRTGEKEGWFTEIGEGHFFIGRDVTADLQISDGRASRRHCEIFSEEGGWKVRDLGSSNGTQVGWEKIKEAVDLGDGTEIGIGATVLVFRTTAPTGSQRRKPIKDEKAPADETSAGQEAVSAAPAAPPPEPSMNTLIAERATLISASGGGDDRAVADLRCLFSVARASTAARTPEAVLAALGESLFPRLEPDRFYVFLGSGADRLAWSVSEGSFAQDPEKVPVSRTVIERAQDEQVAVLMADPEADPEFAAARSIEVNKIITALAAPLVSGGRTVGVLYADRLGRAKSFSEADLELAAAAGLLAAGALSGAEELSRARERISRLAVELGAEEMLGDSIPMGEVQRLIAKAGPADAAILITGESGTGKELAARAVHKASGRAEMAFEVVNCAALAENLIESELFGHVKGAFTGAAEERVGRFELADGGTLFLDEIGELSSGAQAKLLRVLEQGEISRVGESKVRRVDVRVVAATNRDLEAEVKDKKFRQDLYYRLNVLRIPLPPLRGRGEDSELLLDEFLKRTSSRMGKPVPGIEAAAREKLLAYSWPGNVREMKNLVERLVILSAGDKVAAADLPPEISAGGMTLTEAAGGGGGGGEGKLEGVVREHILAVLKSVGGNKSKAADALGIDRSTLYARLKEYGES